MLSDKHKYLFFTMIFLLVLSLIGCNEKEELDGKTVVSATVSKVDDSMIDVKKPHKTYNQENSKELQTFIDAIKRAEKINGVMDVMAPDYLLTLTFEDKTISKYSLWLGEDGGAIMNEKDTHTMYTLPSDLIVDLNKFVK